MSLLDYVNYYDEDQDITPEEMSGYSPVSPAHLMDLHDRGLLALDEVLSHRGWHHKLHYDTTYSCFHAQMWGGPHGEVYYWEGDPNDMCWD